MMWLHLEGSTDSPALMVELAAMLCWVHSARCFSVLHGWSSLSHFMALKSQLIITVLEEPHTVSNVTPCSCKNYTENRCPWWDQQCRWDLEPSIPAAGALLALQRQHSSCSSSLYTAVGCRCLMTGLTQHHIHSSRHTRIYIPGLPPRPLMYRSFLEWLKVVTYLLDHKSKQTLILLDSLYSKKLLSKDWMEGERAIFLHKQWETSIKNVQSVRLRAL